MSRESILVPLDGSELAARILEPVTHLARQGGFEAVTLLGVSDPRGHVTAAEQEEEQDRLQAYLRARAARLAGQGVQADTALARGDAAAGILARIDATHPGLVAMATHGRSGVARFVRGSVAERVLRACPAPLLLANPAGLEAPRWPWRKLLVPLDGSDHAARVLPVVERLASALRAGVTLLRVDPYLAPLEARSEGYDPERAAASLEPVRRRLEAAGVATRVRVTLGVEADQILRAAEDVDLVALTTHGRSGLSRWLFGSVAEHVLRHCPRPLVVVRDAVD